MRFCKELQSFFNLQELNYIYEKATLAYTNEDDEIDYLLWLRDKGKAEIRFDDKPYVQIKRLDDKEEFYTKEAFLQMLKSSKPKKLTYIEVD